MFNPSLEIVAQIKAQAEVLAQDPTQEEWAFIIDFIDQEILDMILPAKSLAEAVALVRAQCQTVCRWLTEAFEHGLE